MDKFKLKLEIIWERAVIRLLTWILKELEEMDEQIKRLDFVISQITNEEDIRNIINEVLNDVLKEIAEELEEDFYLTIETKKDKFNY